MNLEQYRYYYRGYFFETFKRPAKAIEAYRLALYHAPHFAKAAACIAHLYAMQNQFDEAERYFLEAVRLSPTQAEMHFNLGYVRDRQGKYEQAIASFTEAVRLKKTVDRAWYGIGMAQAALGRHEEAAKALEQAAGLQPMHSHAWYALGMASHRSHNPDRVREVVMYLHRIDPVMCRRLIQEADLTDLAYLVKDLAV
jgi:tetratricopeptide (TPR) repeat protein